MGKHSPTPSWENESVPTFKDCALDDDYLLGHNTIPRLIDEEKRTIIAKDLPQSETIVSTSRILVNRNSFRTLEPTMWVDSEIINLVADNNTHVATRKQSSLYCHATSRKFQNTFNSVA
ncbi:hypothetical protein QYF36_026868 [Acer negundo]|nr:hypothetical protein QYF36_026868 [Acer negundo]